MNITTGTGADTIDVLATGVHDQHHRQRTRHRQRGQRRQRAGHLRHAQPPEPARLQYAQRQRLGRRDGPDRDAEHLHLGRRELGLDHRAGSGGDQYKYAMTTRSPVNIWTFGGSVTWNVSANAMSSATGIVVDDNGIPINSVPTEPLSDTAYSPAPAGTPLFNSGGPSYLDVAQGASADCWLMASLAEVAARDPQDIRNMFTYDGTTVDNGATVGLYTVRFFNTSGSAVYIQVDTELPSGGEYYDHVDNDMGTQALWVALAEKAYAEANGLGYVTTSNENQDSYSALNNGERRGRCKPSPGSPASDYSINPSQHRQRLERGRLHRAVHQLADQFLDRRQPLLRHGRLQRVERPTVRDVQPVGHRTLRGGAPARQRHQIYGLFGANAAFLSQNFTTQSLESAAINGHDIDQPVVALPGLATGIGGYTRTGTSN